MKQSTVFMIDKNQAKRLPKAVAFLKWVKKVEIVKQGNARLIGPIGNTWDSWFDGPAATEDFMKEREQPADQERNS